MAKKTKSVVGAKGKIDKLPLFIALIGLAGVLGAAIINIFPNILEMKKQETTNINNDGIPSGYVKYDDPLRIFSMILPSDLILYTRLNTNTGIISLFIPEENSLDKEVDIDSLSSYILVNAVVQNQPVTASEIDKKNEELINSTIADGNLGKQKIIFNQKTDKGYFIKYEIVGNETRYFVYMFNEWDETAFIMMAILTRDSVIINDEAASLMVSNFDWSPSKIIEYIQPLK